MSTVIKLWLLITLVVSICSNGSLSEDLTDYNQHIVAHRCANKLGKCHDDNLNQTIEYLQQRTHVHEAILHNLLASQQVSQPNTRDYDSNLNYLKTNLSTYNLPSSCAETTVDNEFRDNIYVLRIAKSTLKPFYAFCTRENYREKAWTIVQRRQDGSQNFNRNWTDYKHGFGDVHGEYWIGLERLHMMTKNQPHELWVSLVGYYGKYRYAKYSKFSIASEEEGYKLTVGGYKGNAGNSFGSHNHLTFSTKDRDNKSNCATKFESGWWFRSCYRCNLNGVYRSFSNRGMRGGIKWYGLHKKSLKYTHMAIRPL